MSVRRDSRDRPSPHGDQKGPREPGTPQWQTDREQGSGHAPKPATRRPGHKRRPHGGHSGSGGPATIPRRPDGEQGAGHTPTVAPGPRHQPRFTPTSRAPGERLHLHGGLLKFRGLTKPPRGKGTGHAPTASTGEPGDCPRPRGSHTWVSRPATPLRQTSGVQGTGHTPTTARTGCRGPDTPTRQPPWNHFTTHASTLPRWDTGDRTCSHSDQTGPRELTTSPRRPDVCRKPATHPRRPPGAQSTSDTPRQPLGVWGTGHTSTAT